MKKEKQEKKPKKRRGAGKGILFLLLIILILLALLFFGKGFGLGLGGGTGTDDGSVEAMATTDDVQTDIHEESGPVVVEISENSIIFGSEQFDSYDAFEKYFYESNTADAQYILRDNQAKKETYDSVKSLLDSFGAGYSEETAG
ncbi:MAG: hypothetical protein IJ385_05490 [Ruminiclostridium sp.]|nr:hypothetical protein [Ruminiclostridium sp.]